MKQTYQDSKILKKWALDLFPLNRSLTGSGNRKTLNYIKKNINKKLKLRVLKAIQKFLDGKFLKNGK